MYSEIGYIKYGQVGAIVLTIGYFILLISALESEKVQTLKIMGRRMSITIYPADITAVSAWIRVIGLAILAGINTSKLRNMAYEQIHGIKREGLKPQLNITIGAWILLIGMIIEAIGSQQDAQIPRPQIIID